MLFGSYIKQRRNELGYSSILMGEIVGCSASFISGIERGAQFPSTIMACKILDALDLKYNKLNPLTLKIIDGPTFKFKSSLRGRNKESERQLTNRELEKLVLELETRVGSLETLVVSLLAEK
jgi:transcriptional regulator with XRE-family HTH domain